MADGASAEQARERVYASIESVASRGVTERELEKAQNRVRSLFVFSLQSNLQRARRLAEYEMYWGNAELIRQEMDRYMAVSRDDIRRVAGQYFAATNRTVLDVVPAQAANEGGEQ